MKKDAIIIIFFTDEMLKQLAIQGPLLSILVCVSFIHSY